MKIRCKLILIGIAPVVLLVALTAVFLWAASEMDRINRKATVADEIAATLGDLAVLTYEHHIYFEERAHVQWVEKYEFLGKQLERDGALFDTAEEKSLMERLLRTSRNLGFLFDQYGPHPSQGAGLRSDQGSPFHQRITARILQDLALASPTANALHDLNDEQAIALSKQIDVASMLVVGSIAILLLVISFLVIRAFTVPVGILSEAFARISGGDLSCRINSSAKDELGILSRGFDSMAQRLQESSDSLHRLNLELEQRVAERTGDLSHANAELRLNEERLAVLFALSQKEFETEKGLIRYALEEAVRLTRSKVGYLHFFNEDQQTLGLFLWSEAVMEFCTAAKTPHYPLQEAGIWADSVRQRQPVVHNDYQNLTKKKGLPEGHFPLSRHLSVPIFDREKIVAVLGVGNKEEPYDADDIRQLILYMRSTWEMVKRKRVEAELLQQKNLISTIIEGTSEAIYAKDAAGRYIFINDAGAAMLGYGPAEVVGRTDMELLPMESAQEFRATDAQVLSQGQVRIREEVGLIDGRERTFLAHKAPWRDNTGNVVGIIGVSNDITERKQAQESLQQYAEALKRSNKELEHFAYVASHDLQEPLRKIGSFTELLARKYQGRLDEKADIYIGYIVDGAQRMQILINDLLAFSRVTTKGNEFAPVDCNAVLARVQQDLELALKESGARLSVADLPTVMADAGQLGQVFQNLIGNAIKYRAAGQAPEIGVAAVARDGEWIFSVSDSGIGIEPQHFERVFQLFQRLHTREEYSGTGIGLALCKKIVERHGGKIWLESTAGKGSTFFFTLPRGLEQAGV